jgi:aubergine-like protein
LGAIVLTDYNNKTYRIDDVDFNVSPMATFRKKTGEEISYTDYYLSRYNITIQNLQQPLLVSRSTQRDRRAGQDELIYLIPELCRSTGSLFSIFRIRQRINMYTKTNYKSV